MSDYCVIICGRLSDARDEATVWAPVARALQLDDAAFATRVLAAMPLVVRRHLDAAAAGRLAGKLVAGGVDARALPDDEQLAYIERDGSRRGPLPLASLGQLIEPGERYRLRDTLTWNTWPVAASDIPDVTGMPSFDEPEAAPVEETPAANFMDFPPITDGDDAFVPGDEAGFGQHQEPAPIMGSPHDTAPVDVTGTTTPADTPAATPIAAHSEALPPALPTHSAATPSLLLPEDNAGASAQAIDRDTHAALPADGDPGVGMRMLLPVGRSGLAIAAGYLGLLAIIAPIAPLALIVSLLAWRDLRRRPQLHGRGRVIFGLIMGTLMTALLIIVFAGGFYRTEPRQMVPATAHAQVVMPATAATPAATKPQVIEPARATSSADVTTAAASASATTAVHSH